MKLFTPSRLRENLYRILDRVLETGEPVGINRRGRRLKIVADSPRRLDALQPRPDFIVGDPEGLAEIDWSAEWQP